MNEEKRQIEFEERILASQESSMIEIEKIMNTLSKGVSKIIKNDKSIISNILESKLDLEVQKKLQMAYEMNMQKVKNISSFHEKLNQLFQNKIFKSQEIHLAGMKVEEVIDLGCSLESVVEAYKKLDLNSNAAKAMYPIVNVFFHMMQRIQKIVQDLRPVLKEGMILRSSVDTLTDEKVKKTAIVDLETSNSSINASIKGFSFISSPAWEMFKQLGQVNTKEMNFNILHQYREDLDTNRNELQLNKFAVQEKKKELRRDTVFKDIKDLYGVIDVFSKKSYKELTGNHLLEYRAYINERLKYFEENYKGVNEVYFDSKDYAFIVSKLMGLKETLEKLADVPNMHEVYNQKIGKFYKRTSLSSNEKREICYWLEDTMKMSTELSTSLLGALQYNGIIEEKLEGKLKKKREIFKIRKIRKSLGNGQHREITEKVSVLENKIFACRFGEWTYNQETGKDEQVCLDCGEKKERDHICTYDQPKFNYTYLGNDYHQSIVVKKCTSCGKEMVTESVRNCNFDSKGNCVACGHENVRIKMESLMKQRQNKFIGYGTNILNLNLNERKNGKPKQEEVLKQENNSIEENKRIGIEEESVSEIGGRVSIAKQLGAPKVEEKKVVSLKKKDVGLTKIIPMENKEILKRPSIDSQLGKNELDSPIIGEEKDTASVVEEISNVKLLTGNDRKSEICSCSDDSCLVIHTPTCDSIVNTATNNISNIDNYSLYENIGSVSLADFYQPNIYTDDYYTGVPKR